MTMTIGTPPPKDLLKTLDKFAASKLLSHLARLSGVSMATIMNIRSGKTITADTLQRLQHGIEEHTRGTHPQRAITLPQPAQTDAISRGRLHAGVVHLVAQLSDLLNENKTLKEQVVQLRQEVITLRTRLTETEAVATTATAAPVEAVEPAAAIGEIARAVGPQHDALMVRLKDRLPKTQAVS